MALLGSILGNWLKNDGISYRKAAEKTGLSFQEIGHIVTGIREPSLATLKSLWSGLNMPRPERLSMARDYVRKREIEIIAMKEACQDDLTDDS